MLNWDTALEYIKGSLSLPSGFIEKTDNEIKNRLQIDTIPTFSEYFPDDAYTSVLVDTAAYNHARPNWYYFFDEEELDIYSIKECYFSMSNEIGLYHPIQGPINFESMAWWSLEVFKSRIFQQASDYSITYKFREPNIVEVLPGDMVENFAIHYEREQPHDLRKIPNTLKNWFLKLAVADVKIWLGSIRTNYGDGLITTPFGDIPLKGESILAEGRDDRMELIDRFVDQSMPSVILDIG